MNAVVYYRDSRSFSCPALSYGSACDEQCPCSNVICHHVYRRNVTKYTFFTKIMILGTSFNDGESKPIFRQTIDSNGISDTPLRIEHSQCVSFYSNTSDRTMNIAGNSERSKL